MEPILIDTGVIYALFDRDEWAHERCVRALESIHRPLVTCEAVITECCYLLRRRRGAIDAMLANLETGFFGIPLQISRSASQIREILRKYRDTPADFADACLIHMADNLNTGDILTLDSDFKHYRWRRNRSFRLLIPLE
jgi:predicted nucleic acid-binding protein